MLASLVLGDDTGSRTAHGAKLAIWLLGHGSAAEQLEEGWAQPKGDSLALKPRNC